MNITSPMSAREMIKQLVDSNSFVEVGALVTKRSTDFNLSEKEVPSDGVITGYGLINGNPVYLYCQDNLALNGTMGEMHEKKIINMYELACKVGAPVIGIISSGGIRLQEGVDALHGLGGIYQAKVMASGIIPQITAIVGNCGGGTAVLSALSDFTLIAENSGRLYMNSPNSLLGNYKEKQDTSKADFQANSGNVSFLCEDEYSVLEQIKALVNILPASSDDTLPFEGTTDDLNRLLPDFKEKLEDSAMAFSDLSDNHYFLEVKKEYAKEMVTGFIKLNGSTVGVIGNRLAQVQEDGTKVEFAPLLTTDGCKKAEQFVKFCNAFHIPIVTFTNVLGFSPSIEEEHTLPLAVAGLTFAFTNADVPKINLITDKAFGSSYVIMNSKHIGADMVFALEDSMIGTMEPALAAKIMYSDHVELIKEKEAEYEKLQSSAQSAAKRGYIDSVIAPDSVRKHLIYGFEMLHTKKTRGKLNGRS